MVNQVYHDAQKHPAKSTKEKAAKITTREKNNAKSKNKASKHGHWQGQ